ncbi:MAG: FAD-dependent oxidoreductase [Gemmatimonadota bacterium]
MLNILGAGPAGLAAGYYARREGLACRIYEAGSEVGGNCRTLRWGDFRFDTGAHRLHGKDPEVTEVIRGLLGDDLREVHAPSQIYWNGMFIDFPLSPYDLVRKLDWSTLGRIGTEVLRRRLRNDSPTSSFRDQAVAAYGETLAQMFLLGYSAKLWGEHTSRLSPAIAGKRLRGLDLTTFLLEAIGGKRRKNAHLDGSFFYPSHGIGMIFDRVAAAVGKENISFQSRVTDLIHERGYLRSIVLNGKEEIEAGTVMSTLPLTLTLRMLRPRPPAELLETAMSMRFRHLVLGVFLLDRPRLSENASIYFPGDQPYTRLYECKNRSPHMAPNGQTAVVLEIPCQSEDDHWSKNDHTLERELRESLIETGLLTTEEVLSFRSYRVPFAYPILEVGFEEKVGRLLEYLGSFQNLHLLGRSAQFEYSHIHDMFRLARDKVEEIAPSHRRMLARTA